MNATDDKVAYMRDYRKRYRETPDGRAKLREGNRRWKKSPAGKKCNSAYAKKKYVPSGRKIMTPDERAERKRERNRLAYQKYRGSEKSRTTSWKSHILRTYGLSAEDFIAMAKNGCHICGEPDDLAKRLHVDHCHGTGRVRGLLCDPCNRGLGCFRDNTIKLEKALSYLRGG